MADEVFTVLLIEDDEAVVDMYRLRLEQDGYRVVVAEDGETGLRLAGELKPEIVYLDVRLPKMDGFAVLEKIRADPDLAGMPVLILSNYSAPDLIERGLKLGAHDFLIKAETNPSQLSTRTQRWRAEGDTAELEGGVPAS